MSKMKILVLATIISFAMSISVVAMPTVPTDDGGNDVKYYQSKKYKAIYVSDDELKIVQNELGYYGYINEYGEEVIPCIYKRAERFNEGYAVVSKDGNTVGYIDKKGNLIVSPSSRQH